MFKKELFFKKSFIFLFCSLCLILLFSPLTADANENNKLQDIILNLDSDSESKYQVYTHQKIFLESDNIGQTQRKSITIPSHFTFSKEEITKINPEITFTFESEENTGTATILFDNADIPFSIPIYTINAGVGSITFSFNNTIKQREFEISEQSFLSEMVKQKVIPAIPEVNGELLQSRSNPAPPSSAANINLSSYFSLNGNGSIDTTHKNVIVPVVPMAKYHAGTMWSKQKIDLTKDFEVEMYTYSYNPSPLADGIAIAFHNDPKGIKAIGGNGAGLSLYPRVLSQDKEYVANALALELDPHSNFAADDGYDIGLKGHHMEYVKPGNKATMLAQRSHDRYSKPIDNIILNVNAWRLLSLKWNASTKKMTTTFSNINAQGNPTTIIGTLTTKSLNIQEEFGGTNVYWGFGASTGASTGTYYMAMKKMPDVMAGELTKTVNNITNKDKKPSSTTIAAYDDEIEYRILLKNNLDFDSISPLISDELTDARQKLIPNSTKYRVTNFLGQSIASGPISDAFWKNQSTKPVLNYQYNNLAKNTFLEITFRVRLNGSKVGTAPIKNIARMTTNIGLNNSTNETTITMPRYDIIESYQDINGHSIKTEKKTTLLSGINYDSTPPKIPGYTLSGYQIDNEPIVSTTEEVKVSFEKISKNQTIHYIYNQLIKLNIRQIILNPSEELIIPKNGFLELHNFKVHGNENGDQYYNLTVASSLDNVPNQFSQNQLFKGTGSRLSITPIIPEYYQYQGHIVTYENSLHNSGNLQNTAILLDLENQQQFWITIYLTPSLSKNSLPAMYSWDTKLNNLGNILIE